MAASTYLDVGVQRIGEYLTRVPRLAELRNASALISAATAVNGGLLAGLPVSLNTETGQADGVVHLTVDASADPLAVAQALLAKLRDLLPGAQLAASWTAAEDYPQAFARMHSPGFTEQLIWLPSTNEFPLARPCGARPADAGDRADRGCGSRPGMATGHVAELCPDCRNRAKGRSRSADRAERAGRAEVLLRALGDRPDEIASLCPKSETPPKSNHVATIALDGNGVGGVFARLLQSGTAEQRQGISAALSAATEAAFQEAAYQTVRAGRVNLIPVVLGGDDLIAIVAGVDAWVCARTFVDAFVAQVNSKLRPELAGGLSVSGGITFHGVKHPITSAIQTSEALMRRAKGVHNGSVAAFCWIDLTGDALDEAPDLATGLARRPVATAAALSEHAAALRTLASFGHSTLGNLSGIIKQLDELPLADSDRRRYVLAQAARVKAEAAVKPFAYPTDPYPEQAGHLPLPTALDLARWWR
ncbi:MAG: Cas10/Cmr2 second palm domain-containing protein [Candidatus Nanopelagicales bacterium]